MKYLIIIIALVTTVFACNKNGESPDICAETLNCISENCVYTISNTQGTIVFLSCFNRWGINSSDQAPNGDPVWLIVDNLDSSFEQKGLEVIYCGYVRENTVPLQFPDPNVGAVYQIRLVNISLK